MRTASLTYNDVLLTTLASTSARLVFFFYCRHYHFTVSFPIFQVTLQLMVIVSLLDVKTQLLDVKTQLVALLDANR